MNGSDMLGQLWRGFVDEMRELIDDARGTSTASDDAATLVERRECADCGEVRHAAQPGERPHGVYGEVSRFDDDGQTGTESWYACSDECAAVAVASALSAADRELMIRQTQGRSA